MSQTTKKALAASLKKMLAEKTLDKITVKDIVEDCEVNRQTFYYHFQDIYALMEWIFVNEAAQALDGKKTYDTWQQGFYQIFEYMLNNKAFIENTLHSSNRDYVERFLYDTTFNLLLEVVKEQAANMKVTDENKKFIANFYKFAFVGIVKDWIRSGMKEDPEKIIDHIDVLIKGDFKKALETYER
ncbi:MULTISPECIES: TetR/AcrR family transcriptional regulator [Paenibacillus]|uniref:TetR family transcriptional regulator n=1 Tax=Paenibacillus azoreducens TaxID=116718 RepID=A0A920CQT0_9BACL|nr:MULTISPECIES: TetR/AcrR family transcriptional regulator [Paenibacillus]MBE9916078.1 TetR family transcriptional regulator [Paenibacillus donghaensis]GIO45733.1 TetR family transcriptional regulator [Paenibacillus azoreducens]